MKKLLLIIDYQNDFVADQGSFTAGKPAQDIEAGLLRRISAYKAAGDDVICTLDTHTAETWQQDKPESRRFPPHCVENTPGWQLYGQLGQQGLDTLTKTAYMLDQADIDWLVRQYNVIELAGVASDICVLQNAIGLYNHAINQDLNVTFQITAGCAATFAEANHQYALNYMKDLLGFSVLAD